MKHMILLTLTPRAAVVGWGGVGGLTHLGSFLLVWPDFRDGGKVPAKQKFDNVDFI